MAVPPEEIRPGAPFDVHVHLKNYRNEPSIETATIVVPAGTLPEGPLCAARIAAPTAIAITAAARTAATRIPIFDHLVGNTDRLFTATG